MAIVALADCNSFYCACEMLFRPDLVGRPVGVLSNNDGNFVSRTPELKALGVKMGDPYFQVREICELNNVAVFSSNFTFYTNISTRVMTVLARFAPKIEIYSVDEAFLDFTGLEHRDLDKYAREIIDTVKTEVGISISIGIASTKTLAKVANRIAKKFPKTNGHYSLLKNNKLEWALENTSVEDIWGIGRSSAAKLRAINIKTAKAFRDFKNDIQIQKLLTKVGRKIQDELRGVSCIKLNDPEDKKKEIGSSRSFGQGIYDVTNLREAIANFATTVCEKLRAQGSVCSEVTVWITTNPFKEGPQYRASESLTIQAPTLSTFQVISYAWCALDKIFEEGYEYKKAMVRISGFQNLEERQLSFLEKPDSERTEKLMKTIDQINTREGRGMIKPMACGISKKNWDMKQLQRSPRFTTGWYQLPKVK